MSNSTARPPRSGYDLPVYGLADGLLLNIHVPAILCITISLLCAVATVAWSVRSHWVRGRGARFFDWTQGERNIVYLAVCDGCFNLAHLFDHAHYLLLRDHVRPAWLCQLYAFVISEFICAQHLLVNLIAVSACVTIHRERMVEWGARDWRQLLYTFGGSLLIDIGCLVTGAYGPTGSFCYFDPVAGVVPHLVFSVAPLVILFSMNVLLYVLTFRKIRLEERRTRAVLGATCKPQEAAPQAARTGMLFVSAFFIQWWTSVLWGLWQLFEPPPVLLHHLTTTFCNLGGALNFGVFYILRRRRRRRQPADSLRQQRSEDRGDSTAAAVAGCRPNWLRICSHQQGVLCGGKPAIAGEPLPPRRATDAPDGARPAEAQVETPAQPASATPMSDTTPLSGSASLSASTPLSDTAFQPTTAPIPAGNSQPTNAPQKRKSFLSKKSPTSSAARSPGTSPPRHTSPLFDAVSRPSTTPLSPAELLLVARRPDASRKVSVVSPRYGGRKAPPPETAPDSEDGPSPVCERGCAGGRPHRHTPPQVIISSEWAGGDRALGRI